MWTRALTLLVSLSFAPTALAQSKLDHAEGPPPEETATASETSTVQAAPDVQAQVGLGTEKDETGQETYAPSSPFEGDAERERRARKKDFGHFMQVGARGGISIPYKIMFRFDDSPECNVNNKDGEEGGKVCGLLAPPALDLALSFALLDAIEPYVWMRMGLNDETKTQTEALRVFGAGVRIYTMSDSMFKVFFEPAVGVETEGALNAAAAASADYGTDFFIHLNAGLQVDFIRNLGVYISLGPNVSFLRAITTTLEGNVGLQVRVP